MDNSFSINIFIYIYYFSMPQRLNYSTQPVLVANKLLLIYFFFHLNFYKFVRVTLANLTDCGSLFYYAAFDGDCGPCVGGVWRVCRHIE